MFTQRFSNERGVSIVEGLVGLGAIVGLAAVIATISTNTNNRGLIYKRACESMATNALDAITDEGIFMNVYHFTPSNNGGVKQHLTTDEGLGLYTIDEIANGDLWPGAMNIISPNPISSGADLPPVIRNEVLIQGAMRALNSLYNNQAGTDYCSGFVPYAPNMTIGALGIENELTRSDPNNPPTIELRLQAINFNTNNTFCPNKPVFIAPRSGLASNRQAYRVWSYDSLENGLGAPKEAGKDGIWENESEFSIALKWRLSTRVNYTYNNENFDCTISRDFKYPRDANPPRVNQITMSVVNNQTRQSDYEDYSACNNDPKVTDVGINIRIDYIKPGSLLFCRDISEEFVYNDPSQSGLATGEQSVSPVCYQGNGVSNSSHGRVNPREQLTNTAYVDQLTGGGAADDVTEDKWFPCHAARICSGVGGSSGNFNDDVDQPGVAPASVVIYDGAATPELTQQGDYPYTISLSYTGVPEDCIIGMEVIAVDIAGNTSGYIRDYQPTNVIPVSGEVLTFRGLINSSHAVSDVLYSSGAGTEVDASIGGFNKQGMHRRWCGNRNGFAPGTIGNGSNGTWGIETEHGIWCRPPTAAEAVTDLGTTGGPVTPNWWTVIPSGYNPHGVSTDVPGNPTALLNTSGVGAINGNENWVDEFPNGYYTCNPGGCCFGPTCRPWD